MSGQTAANILKKFPFDDALTIKIVGVLGEDKEKIHEGGSCLPSCKREQVLVLECR